MLFKKLEKNVLLKSILLPSREQQISYGKSNTMIKRLIIPRESFIHIYLIFNLAVLLCRQLLLCLSGINCNILMLRRTVTFSPNTTLQFISIQNLLCDTVMLDNDIGNFTSNCYLLDT